MKGLCNTSLDQEAIYLVCGGFLVDSSDRVAAQCAETIC